MTEEEFVAGNHTDKYGTKNPISRALMNGFMNAARELYGQTGASTMVELGCGEGELAARLLEHAPAEYLGTDLSTEIIEEAKSRFPHLKFEAHSADGLPFEENSFDLVVACEVLEHVENPREVLREIKRLSRKWVLVSVPREPIWRALNMARGSYWSDMGNTPGHIQHWGRRQFIRMVSEELEILQVKSPLPWTMILARVPQD
jgi:2-polyprenyl-3-methyl-5-hydroxy-6-metoxy-1,4-benzoquinol methylase